MHKALAIVLLTLLDMLVVAFLWNHSLLSAALVLLLGVTALLITRRRSDVILYVSIALVSFFGEALFVYLGTWTHNNPDLLGVPLRLPLSWGILALAIAHISKYLDEKFP